MCANIVYKSITKAEVLRKAKLAENEQEYDPVTSRSIDEMAEIPWTMAKYLRKDEPDIDVEGFNDSSQSAWLTLNHYNAAVLSSRNMLITDVDFNNGPQKQCIDNVIVALMDLGVLDDPLSRLQSESYRVYRTHSGCRVICTSVAIPLESFRYPAIPFLQYLNSDPKYIDLCNMYGCYRARLMPKPWRCGDISHVCDLVATIGNGYVNPNLESQLKLHDVMTLREFPYSSLA